MDITTVSSKKDGTEEERGALLAAPPAGAGTSYTETAADRGSSLDTAPATSSAQTKKLGPVALHNPKAAAETKFDPGPSPQPHVLRQRSAARPSLGRVTMPKSKMDDFEALNGIASCSIIKTHEAFLEAEREHHDGKHHVPHQNRTERWVLNALIGVVCGLTSFMLKMCVQFLANQREGMIKAMTESVGTAWLIPTWFSTFVFAASLVIISAAIIIFIEPNAAGSGIPETCAFLNGVIIPKTFSVSVLGAKFVSCGLAVGSGLPVGPEGPMIHMGSVIGSLLSQGTIFGSWLPTWVAARIKCFRNVSDRRDFMAAGVAGGVSAAFGAPIGGLLFVAEEIASHWDIHLGMQASSSSRLISLS